MKSPITSLAALAVFTIAVPASAATLLFSDNFDTVQVGASVFNTPSALSADQSGSAATRNYTINALSGWDGAFQRGNGGTWLMYAGTSGFGDSDMRGSLNYDIADAANTLGQALQISFNISVINGVAADDWTSFTIGTQNPFVNAGSVGFGALFRDNGATQQFSNGPEIGNSATFTDGQLITFILSDATGSGSAFSDSNGANDLVKMYVNGTLTNTWSNLNLDAADQFISFHANNTVANIDNLTITAIPEPGAALLGSLGLIALLRRRRA
jgi:hypothetical protein